MSRLLTLQDTRATLPGISQHTLDPNIQVLCHQEAAGVE